MNAVTQLLTDHLDIWTAADTEKKSGRGRSAAGSGSNYGIKKLRELILELAVRGKLVPQDPNDEPASILLNEIERCKGILIQTKTIKKDKPLISLLESQTPFMLPNSWLWVRLGQITNFGSTEKLSSIPDDAWVLDLEDIEKDTSKLLGKFRFAERRALSDKNAFKAGDVLYGKLRPYLNKVIVADEDGVCTTEILPIRCFGPFVPDYFKFALKSPCFLNYVNERSYGMKMPRLGTDDGRNAPFPLPPLAEQYRIVAKLDELMALCDQLEAGQVGAAEAHEKLVSHLLGTLTQSQDAEDFVANWRRIATHFDTLFTTEASIDALKQTILQLAVMGKLVPQDPNDEPASELLKLVHIDRVDLESKKRSKRVLTSNSVESAPIPFDLASGWICVRLDEIGSTFIGLTYSPKDVSEFGIPVLRSSNVQNGKIDLDDLVRVNVSVRSNLIVGNGDLLICARNGSRSLVGKTARIQNLTEQMTFGAFMAIYKSRFNEYIEIFLNSPMFRRRLEGVETTTINQLTQDNLKNTLLPLPPLAEQHRIVAKVDELMALCDRLKARLSEVNRVQQIFADALVAQAVAKTDAP